jgi:hypothetical protein
MGLLLLASASLRDGEHTVGSCLGVNGLGGENLQFLGCEAHDVCRRGRVEGKLELELEVEVFIGH